MRILLPPSEAKRPGGRGRPLADRPSDGWLDHRRDAVRAALARTVARRDAAVRLRLPESVAMAALDRNARLETAPTRSALDRYQGTLYDGLAVAGFDRAERRRAERELLIFSGLFGVLSGGEPVPDYRVPAAADLAGLGILSTYWRRALAADLPTHFDDGLIVDLRSTDYASMWKPTTAELDRLVTVRVLSPRPNGTLGVISYPSKHAKGRFAGRLIRHRQQGGRTDTAEQLAELWTAAGERDAELRTGRSGAMLDLITATATVVGRD